jgi:menaquinone-dependent protoporphyrinogen IX oxidase
MRVCVLYAGAGSGATALKRIAEALAKGIQENGNTVDLFDMSLEEGRKISFYDYVVIGTEATTFFGGKIPSTVQSFSSERRYGQWQAMYGVCPQKRHAFPKDIVHVDECHGKRRHVPEDQRCVAQ